MATPQSRLGAKPMFLLSQRLWLEIHRTTMDMRRMQFQAHRTILEEVETILWAYRLYIKVWLLFLHASIVNQTPERLRLVKSCLTADLMVHLCFAV